MLTKTLARRAMQEKITARTATQQEIVSFRAAEAHRLRLGIVSLPLTTSLTDPRLTELCNKFVAAAQIAPRNTQIEILKELTERAFSVPKKQLPFGSNPQALRAHAALLAWAAAINADIPKEINELDRMIKSLDNLPQDNRQDLCSSLSIADNVKGLFLSHLPS